MAAHLATVVGAIKDAGNPFLRLINNVTGDTSTLNVPYFQQEQVKEAAFQSQNACETIHKGLHARLEGYSHDDVITRKTLELIKLLLLEGPNPAFQQLMYSQSSGKVLAIANIKKNDPSRSVPRDSILEGNINLAAAIHKGIVGDKESLASYGIGQLSRNALGQPASSSSTAAGAQHQSYKSDFQSIQEREQKNFKKRREEEKARRAGIVTTEKHFEQFDATLAPQKLVDYAVNHAKKKFAEEELDNFVEAAEEGGKVEEVCACLDKVLKDGKSALQNRFKVLTIVDVMIRNLTPALIHFQRNNAGVYRHVALEAGDNPTKSALMQQLATSMMDILHGKVKVPASVGIAAAAPTPAPVNSNANAAANASRSGSVGNANTAITATTINAAGPSSSSSSSVSAAEQQMKDMMAKMQAMQAQLLATAASQGGGAAAAAAAPTAAQATATTMTANGWGDTSTSAGGGWGDSANTTSAAGGGWGFSASATSDGWGAPPPTTASAVAPPTPQPVVVVEKKKDLLDDLFDTNVPAPSGPSTFGLQNSSAPPPTAAVTHSMTEHDAPMCPNNSIFTVGGGGAGGGGATKEDFNAQLHARQASFDFANTMTEEGGQGLGGNNFSAAAVLSGAAAPPTVASDAVKMMVAATASSSPPPSDDIGERLRAMAFAQQQMMMGGGGGGNTNCTTSSAASQHQGEAHTPTTSFVTTPVMAMPPPSSTHNNNYSTTTAAAAAAASTFGPSNPTAAASSSSSTTPEADAALKQMQMIQQRMQEMIMAQMMAAQQQQAMGLVVPPSAPFPLPSSSSSPLFASGGEASSSSPSEEVFSPTSYYKDPYSISVAPSISTNSTNTNSSGSKRPQLFRLIANLEEQMEETRAVLRAQEGQMKKLQDALQRCA